MLRYAISAGLIAIVSSTVIFARPKAPATRPAPATTTRPAGDDKAWPESMKVTVKSVTGIAERRDRNVKNGKWEQMKAGDILSEHTIIRTGLGCKTVLQFGEGNDVTIRSGTKIGMSSFSKDGKRVKTFKTRLGLKYEEIRAKVDASRGPNDFRVHTPVPTLAAGRGGPARWGDFTFQSEQVKWAKSTTKPAPAATTRPADKGAAATRPSSDTDGSSQ